MALRSKSLGPFLLAAAIIVWTMCSGTPAVRADVTTSVLLNSDVGVGGLFALAQGTPYLHLFELTNTRKFVVLNTYTNVIPYATKVRHSSGNLFVKAQDGADGE